MQKILKMKQICPFFFCQKFCIKFVPDYLLQNATVGSWVYSQAIFVMLWHVLLSELDLPPLPPKSKNVRIPVFTQSNMILFLQKLINLMFS